ncbi:MAG: AEC family transporter [Candidatus Sericytochromatia bacterium]|nr:AEC family transporter [Candidatus Sericytochromatia bacterium]
MNTVLLSFALIIALGVGWRRFAADAAAVEALRSRINATVFNLFLPALCIKVLSTTGLDRAMFVIPLVALISLAITLAFAASVYRLLQRPLGLAPRETGALIIAATFGNVTYLGLPVLSERFGPGAAGYAIFFDLFASTPMLWLAGVALAAHYGSGAPFRLDAALRTLLGLPPLWGCAVGVLLSVGHVTLPASITHALGLLAGLVVPLMIFSIGLALQMPKIDRLKAIWPALLIKMALVPLLTYAVARLCGLSGPPLAAVALEGAMPTMVLALLIARQFKLDEGLTALCIAVSTALSFATLPLADRLLSVGLG